MRKNQYYQHKKHCSYFSLYWSFGLEPTLKTKNHMRELYSSEMKMQQGASERGVEPPQPSAKAAQRREAHTQATSNDAASSFPMSIKTTVCIVASKKGVHKHAVNRNFAKRRLRATLRNFLKTESLPLVTLRIVAKKEILSCSFADLNLMLHKNLKAI